MSYARVYEQADILERWVVLRSDARRVIVLVQDVVFAASDSSSHGEILIGGPDADGVWKKCALPSVGSDVELASPSEISRWVEESNARLTPAHLAARLDPDIVAASALLGLVVFIVAGVAGMVLELVVGKWQDPAFGPILLAAAAALALAFAVMVCRAFQKSMLRDEQLASAQRSAAVANYNAQWDAAWLRQNTFVALGAS